MPRRKAIENDFKMGQRVKLVRRDEISTVRGFAGEVRGLVLPDKWRCASLFEFMDRLRAEMACLSGIRWLVKCEIKARGELMRYAEDLDSYDK